MSAYKRVDEEAGVSMVDISTIQKMPDRSGAMSTEEDLSPTATTVESPTATEGPHGINKRFYFVVIVILAVVQYMLTWTHMEGLTGMDENRYNAMCGFSSASAIGGIAAERRVYFGQRISVGETDFTDQIKCTEALSAACFFLSLSFNFVAWCIMLTGNVEHLISNGFIWWMLSIGSLQSGILMISTLVCFGRGSYSLFKWCCP
jgi:hypothetical protein